MPLFVAVVVLAPTVRKLELIAVLPPEPGSKLYDELNATVLPEPVA